MRSGRRGHQNMIKRQGKLQIVGFISRSSRLVMNQHESNATVSRACTIDWASVGIELEVFITITMSSAGWEGPAMHATIYVLSQSSIHLGYSFQPFLTVSAAFPGHDKPSLFGLAARRYGYASPLHFPIARSPISYHR